MMINKGFKVDQGRIINPTAVFCSDRNAYYEALQKADNKTEDGLLFWIEYVLRGLSEEIKKIDNLLEYDYVKSKIFLPTIKNAEKKRILNPEECKVLEIAIQNQEFKTTQLNKYFKSKSSVALSRIVKRLRDRSFLTPISENSRTYVFSFIRNEMMREIMKTLDNEGFLPMRDEI